MSEIKIKRKIAAWLQLMRPPNLPTVPGDAAAGFLLANLTEPDGLRLLPCLVTSLFLYIAGLIWNDCADYAEDLVTRPRRPLPAGLVSRRAAALAGTIFAITGIAVSFLAGPLTPIISVSLLALILLYDFALKRVSVLGPLNMGLCRGFNVLLGASAAGWHGMTSAPVMIAASGITLYICAVSNIASHETLRDNIGFKRWMPLIVLAGCFVAFFLSVRPFSYLSFFIGLIALVLAWQLGHKLRDAPEPSAASAAVGTFIKGLLLIQAAFCAIVPMSGIPAAVALLLLWPVSTLLAKRFYAS